MSDEFKSSDMGFGTFAVSEQRPQAQPQLQTTQIEAQKPVGTTVKERKLVKPTSPAETATELQSKVGPARAANITPIVDDPGFQKDAAAAGLASVGLGALGLASIFGAGYYMGKKGKPSEPGFERKEPFFESTKNIADSVTNPTTEAPPPVHKDAPLLARGLENTGQNALNQELERLRKQSAVPGAAAPAVAPTPVAPPAAPTVSQAIATGQSPTQAIQTEVAKQIDTTPAQPVEPPKNKGGRPKGAKTLTAEERAAQEAAKGINMYRNLFGFETSNPTSPKSLAAIEATNRFISESFSGKIPGSRDPFLNPSTDIGASGKKFYSGTPEGYRNNYIPWLEKNLNTLPPETQSHILHSMTKGQAGDIGKILKGLGVAATGLGAAGIAFAETPKERQAAAKEFAFDLATGIPLAAAVGGPAAAVGAMALGSSGLNKREDEQLARIKAQERQAALLGSPYAGTEWAKKQRQGVPPPR